MMAAVKRFFNGKEANEFFFENPFRMTYYQAMRLLNNVYFIEDDYGIHGCLEYREALFTAIKRLIEHKIETVKQPSEKCKYKHMFNAMDDLEDYHDIEKCARDLLFKSVRVLIEDQIVIANGSMPPLYVRKHDLNGVTANQNI